MRSSVDRGFAAFLVVVCLGLVGCARSGPMPSDPDPAQVQHIAGSDLRRVVLSEEASQNLGIRTEPVRQATLVTTVRSTQSRSTGSKRTTSVATTRSVTTTKTFIPMTAVVYDPEGLSWVYTSPAPLSFLRARIVIDHTTADTAYLKSGPPVGTAVVTVGASELLGTEYGVGGE